MLMKAIEFNDCGSVEAPHLKEVPKPEPKDDEVLIRVHAASINSCEWEFLNSTPFMQRLMFGLFRPKPGKRILGADIAGTVEGIGRHVTRFQPGDSVFGDLSSNWNGCGEYACASETSLQPKPTNSSYAEAAAVPQAGLLALQGLLKVAPLKPSQRVLINGAGGGVGTFAVQLAKLSGAEVTGVDTAHKLDLLRSLGADHVVDYTQVDFTNTGKRYDLIIDCHNVRSIFHNRRALRDGGTYAMIGGPQVLPLLLMNRWASATGQSRRFCLVEQGAKHGLADLKNLIEAGRLTPVVNKIFPLDQVPEALRYFGRGLHKGKLVIDVSGQAAQGQLEDSVELPQLAVANR